MDSSFKKFMGELGEWSNFAKVIEKLKIKENSEEPLRSFDWECTPQGPAYWALISKLYQDYLLKGSLDQDLTLLERFFNMLPHEELTEFQKGCLSDRTFTPIDILKFFRDSGNSKEAISDSHIWNRLNSGAAKWSSRSREYREVYSSFQRISKRFYKFPVTLLEMFLTREGKEVPLMFYRNLINDLERKGFEDYKSIPDYFRKEGNDINALIHSCVFNNTPEGHRYWYDMHLRYESFVSGNVSELEKIIRNAGNEEYLKFITNLRTYGTSTLTIPEWFSATSYEHVANDSFVFRKTWESSEHWEEFEKLVKRSTNPYKSEKKTYLEKYFENEGRFIADKFKKYLEQTAKDFDSYLFNIGNLECAISGGFSWEDTAEGKEFWQAVSNRYKEFVKTEKYWEK